MSVSLNQEPKYTKKDFQVGQTVYIEQISASTHYMKDTVGKLTKGVVEKVGTTHVTMDKGIFHLADGLVKDNFNRDFLLHLTYEDAEHSALARKWKKEILSKMDYRLVEYMTLDELGTLVGILDIAEFRKEEQEKIK